MEVFRPTYICALSMGTSGAGRNDTAYGFVPTEPFIVSDPPEPVPSFVVVITGPKSYLCFELGEEYTREEINELSGCVS